MKRAVFHPEASQEYLAALKHHANLSAELGQRFDQEIQRLVTEISRDPQRFFRFHPPAQRALSRKFPILWVQTGPTPYRSPAVVPICPC